LARAFSVIGSSWAICDLMARKALRIEPFDPSLLKGASYTLRIGGSVRLPRSTCGVLDTRSAPPEFDEIQFGDEGYVIEPAQFLIATSLEFVELGPNIACILSGRGSCARLGLNVLQSSSFAEPVTRQHLDFEISNASATPVRIWAGMPAVKAVFLDVSDRLGPSQRKAGRKAINRIDAKTQPDQLRLALDEDRTQ
jgi:dCTP deaminase